MKKKLRASIFLLVFSFFLLGCEKQETAGVNGNEKSINACDLECEKADMDAYNISDNHLFLSVNFKEVKKLFDDDFTGVIYFGYDTCAWCLEAVPILDELMLEYNQEVYYVNKHSDINKEHPEWEEAMTEYLDNYIDLEIYEETGEPRIFVPEVIVVKDGEIVAHHLGTVDDHDAYERKMSEEEALKLKNTYDEMFKMLE